jgi:hypothetical protein
MSYNPYDLVSVEIYGVVVFARPIKFSGSIVNNAKSLDAFGQLVRPVLVHLTCPVCGGLVEFSLVPPCVCAVCEASRPVKVNPFIDPIRFGRLRMCDLVDHAFNPKFGFNIPVNIDKRRTVFDDFLTVSEQRVLPKSDLGLEDMVEE